MEEDVIALIMGEYDQQRDVYFSLTEKACSLITELLEDKKIRFHSIGSRLKHKDSLQKKLGIVEKRYLSLKEITDIAGIRIITYFEDDVNAVAKIIEGEFDIDKENSIDKRASLDADRFGYLSLHYICGFSSSRLQLTEYRRFENCNFEVQIRSILQHAWAEIEHDLGYKSKVSIPKQLRRRFSRLAGLLEIADSEFVQLRDGLADYEKRISKEINETPGLVSIDLVSLRSFVSQNAEVQKWDKLIADISERKLVESDPVLAVILKILFSVGIQTIEDINVKLKEYSKELPRFTKLYINGLQKSGWIFGENIGAGVSLTYVCHLIMASTHSKSDVLRYFREELYLDKKAAETCQQALIQAHNRITAKVRKRSSNRNKPPTGT